MREPAAAYAVDFKSGKFVFARNGQTFDTFGEAAAYAARVRSRDEALDAYESNDDGMTYLADFYTNPLVGVFENSYTVDPVRAWRDVVLTDFWKTHSLMFRQSYFGGDNQRFADWLGMAERAYIQAGGTNG